MKKLILLLVSFLLMLTSISSVRAEEETESSFENTVEETVQESTDETLSETTFETSQENADEAVDETVDPITENEDNENTDNSIIYEPEQISDSRESQNISTDQIDEYFEASNQADLLNSNEYEINASGDPVTINGVTITYTSSSYTTNCWAYANELYKKIWGKIFTSDRSTNDNIVKNYSKSDSAINANNLKQFVLKSAPGSVIRVCVGGEFSTTSDSNGHSQLIVSIDANGYRVFESNVGTNPGRRDIYRTWSEWVNWYTGKDCYYEYIKYILTVNNSVDDKRDKY